MATFNQHHQVVTNQYNAEHITIYTQATPRPVDAASRNRRAMIEKVWAIWITGMLQPSLPQDILLDLGLTERPTMITRPLDLLVQRPDLADQVQASGTQLVDSSIAWTARCSSWARRGPARRRCC